MASIRYLVPIMRRLPASPSTVRGVLQQVRGKKDISVWPGRAPALRPFRRDNWVFDDPFFSNVFRTFGPASIEQQMKNAIDQMNRIAARAFDWPAEGHGENAEVVQAKIDKDGLSIKMNVSHYEPDELSVKVVGDRLVISGKHEKKSDEYSFVSREFTREFLIPEEIDAETLGSRLTEDGHLIISARTKSKPVEEGRTIAIESDKQKTDKESKDGGKDKQGWRLEQMCWSFVQI